MMTVPMSPTYDWSHVAARYFKARVDAKCPADPSLAVAHCCFWKYHPERARIRKLDKASADSQADIEDAPDDD